MQTGTNGWRAKRLVAYSPKARRVAKKLVEIRECIGLTRREAAMHLGVEEGTLAKYEKAVLIPGREMQRRMLLYYFGKWSWESAPSAPAVQGNHRGRESVLERIRMSPETQVKLDALCKKFESSAGAVIELAIELMHDNVPVITTLKEAARRYEDLRWRSILDGNADLGTLLDSDPIMARVAHEGLQYTHAKDKLLDPTFLMAWLDRKDEGAYMKVADIKWRRVDRMEQLEEIR